ncbi:hypothetical protein CDO73_16805 [Saccharibacillus sp. O23]|uniref:hypothetical protein n=1 Tax=Saccharibacillus sp. O23 TaxID=2009338 RepID=UPI000B4E2579|nr:hypothetical protein [Saccharibacillus sp. O23]OWR28873.1 hypothetical protein CDO73_16805 [Saccharibacillus sp. O23]
MTTINNNERERELANQAWAKMEERLRQEPANPAWATWEARKNEALQSSADESDRVSASETADFSSQPLTGSPERPAAAQAEKGSAEGSPSAVPAASSARRRLSAKARKNIVRLAVTAAAAAAIVTAVTPAGNKALADVLNKFTMQDVVLVQENDMRNMVQQVFNGEEPIESKNRYGTFENISKGRFEPNETPQTFIKKLGFKPIVSPDGAEMRMNMSLGSQTIMKLNVAEVNETMRRLGAPYLFPQEADGKAITLNYPDSISYNFDLNDDDGSDWATLTQSEAPTVDFDDSFPFDETMNAVINFPGLPGDLKDSLERSAVSSGELPLVMYANGEGHQIEVNGVTATYTYDAQHKVYDAFWKKDGVLYEYSAAESFRKDEAGFLTFLKGLVAQ